MARPACPSRLATAMKRASPPVSVSAMPGVATGLVGSARTSASAKTSAQNRSQHRRAGRQRPHIVDAGQVEARAPFAPRSAGCSRRAAATTCSRWSAAHSTSITTRRSALSGSNGGSVDRPRRMPAVASTADGLLDRAATSASTGASDPRLATARRRPAHAEAEPGPIVGHRPPARRRVVVVLPGDRLQHQRQVLGRASQRADMIERVRQRHAAIAADPAVGRLQPDHAAAGGRDSGSSRRCPSPASPGSAAPPPRRPRRWSSRR